MIIRYVSDLHLECYSHETGMRMLSNIPEGSDVLVAAGDIMQFSAFEDDQITDVFEDLASKAQHLVYVAGNHEHYRSHVSDVEDILNHLPSRSRYLMKRMIVLRPEDEVVIQGKRFIGGTLWFDESWKKLPNAENVKACLNDFYQISGFEEPAQGRSTCDEPWVYEQNKALVDFFQEELSEGDIVVTHHLPSHESVPPQYKNDPLNAFFVHALDDLILERKPALLIHGHTHTPCDYILGSTRVVANPMGYPNEDQNGFRWDASVELP